MNHDQAPQAVPLIGPPSHDPYAAFRFANFNLYMMGNFLAIVGRQMLAVAVEWEIYRRTHSATALGLVGLVLAVPVVCLSLPAGHLADKYSRKHIIMIAQFFSAIASAAPAAFFKSARLLARPLSDSSSRTLAFPAFTSSTPSARFSFFFSCCRSPARRPGKNARNKIPGAACRQGCVLF